MFKNYLKITLRNLLRFKVYSFINIAGLAAGMAASLLIFLYVQHELSYDRFNEKADRIFRLITEDVVNGKIVRWAFSPSAYAPDLLNEFPQIIHAVRIAAYGSVALRHGNNPPFRAKDFVFADSSVLEVFTFPLSEGNPKTALKEPFSLVLTEATARKFFENENPNGKIIRFENKFDFKVTGIVKDVPSNSTLQFDYLASFVSLKDILKEMVGMSDALHNYTSYSFSTYLLLSNPAEAKDLERRFTDFLYKSWGEKGKKAQLLLQPLVDIYMNRDIQIDRMNRGDERYIYIFSAAAFFILLVACVNFVNLSTARSTTRAKEVGWRKLQGAHRDQIMGQFIIESLLISFVAMLLAITIIELFLPVFNGLSGKQLTSDYLGKPFITVALFVVWLFVGFVSGSYPAFYLSSLQPASVLKGTFKSGAKGAFLRKSLIVFQFIISVTLIIGTAIIYRQYDFMKSQKLGFDKVQVILLPLNSELKKSYEAFKQRLLHTPNVIRLTESSSVPGQIHTIATYSYHGEFGEEKLQCATAVVDPDYIPTLGLNLIAGRNFLWNMPGDKTEAYILNEAAVKKLGWSTGDAIGKEFYKSEERLSQVFGYFSMLAIFIACLGLFGLSSYTTEQRTKEIGIRKVLGASVPTIVSLLSKEFVELVLFANLIAWPIAYFAMNKWLQEYAYRVRIGWEVFALAGVSVFLIALLTVSYQALKAALANPVESLRYE